MKNYNKFFNTEQRENKIVEDKEKNAIVDNVVPDKPQTVTVISPSGLNVRMEPIKDSAVKHVVYSGETLTVLGTLTGWTRIRTKSGIEGYVMNDYIKL